VTGKLNQLGLLILACLTLVIVGVLLIISHPVPTELYGLAAVLIGAASGVAVPATPSSSSSSTVTPSPTTVPQAVEPTGA
jgi:hypothetical protein